LAYCHHDRGSPGRAALFATGATVGVLMGDPLVRRGLRQLAIGAAASVVTYALGRVFGATLG
jgi:vacuolar iron transporter family protein